MHQTHDPSQHDTTVVLIIEREREREEKDMKFN